jgi:hypothetical protein
MPVLLWRLLTLALALASAALALAPLLLPAQDPAAASGWGWPPPAAELGLTAAAALAALVMVLLTRGCGVPALVAGLLAVLLLAGVAAGSFLGMAPATGVAFRTAGLAGLLLAALLERRQDPFANSAYAAARRLGVPERQPRRG